MKCKPVKMLLTLICLFALGMPLFAHHGTGASYDTTKQVTVKGTVTGFKWSNPHVQIYFDAQDADGNVVHWSAEGASPFTYAKAGWNRNTLKPGDKITVVMNPSKVEGVPAGVINHVVLPDGTEALRFYGEPRGPAPATEPK